MPEPAVRNYSDQDCGPSERDWMKQRNTAPIRRRSKPGSPPAERQEQRNDAAAESLLKEVAEANANVTNPEERERVIPSRPC